MVSVNSMEIVYGLTKVHRLEQSFLNEFIHLCFKQCLESPEKSVTRVKTIVSFVTELIDKNMFDITSKIEVWLYYCNKFDNIKAAKDFHTHLKNKLVNQQGK